MCRFQSYSAIKLGFLGLESAFGNPESVSRASSFPTSLENEADQAGGTTNDVTMKLLSCCVLPQAVAIHFEKVSRREIGVFTAPKTRLRAKHVTPPASGKEPLRSYSRTPILFSALDSIGHCFQVKRGRVLACL